MRPGTGMRTSYGGPVVGGGVGLTTNIDVTARAGVLQEGMRAGTGVGATPGTSHGPKRKVVDAGYCLNILRPRIAEMKAEITRMNDESNAITNGESTLMQLQEKNRVLNEEIERLKNNLSDANFAVQSAGRDVESLSKEAAKIRDENNQQRKTVDKIFLSVKETDKQTAALKQQLQNESATLEAKLQQTNQDVGLYRQTRDEAYEKSDSIHAQQTEILRLIARRDQITESVKNDNDKKRATQLMLEILRKRNSRDAMRKECSVSIEQERQNLIQQAKATASDIDVLTRQVQEAKDTVADTKNRVQSAVEEASEYSGENMRKYHELKEKDKTMQDFIDAFPQAEMDEARKLKDAEDAIVALLEKISRAHVLKASIPQEGSQQVMDQIAADLSEKENQFKNAKATFERLEMQVAERKEELQKIETLDEKITNELKAIAAKMQERKEDIARYSDIDALRTDIDARKKSLVARKGFLLKQRDSSKQRVHALSVENEQKKSQLSENNIQSTLSAQEQKLRLIWQSAYSMEEYVRHKEKDTQFLNIKADCMRITDEVNSVLKDPKRFEAQTVSIVTN